MRSVKPSFEYQYCEVQAILDKKRDRDGNQSYLIQWKGYDLLQSAWYYCSQVQENCMTLVDKFEQQYGHLETGQRGKYQIPTLQKLKKAILAYENKLYWPQQKEQKAKKVKPVKKKKIKPKSTKPKKNQSYLTKKKQVRNEQFYENQDSEQYVEQSFKNALKIKKQVKFQKQEPGNELAFHILLDQSKLEHSDALKRDSVRYQQRFPQNQIEQVLGRQQSVQDDLIVRGFKQTPQERQNKWIAKSEVPSKALCEFYQKFFNP